MRIVHLNESKFAMLMESDSYLPFKTFYDETVKFLNTLLKDPINAKPSEKLRSHGIESASFRKKLYDKGIIDKKERIDEPYDEETRKMTSRYYVTYTVKETETVKRRLRELYKEMFENNE